MKREIASYELTNRFIEGLKQYNLTYDEILSGNWKYCGGNKGRHFNYFVLFSKGRDLPQPGEKYICVCGHHIVENCYITDNARILVLGNCCIKKFIPKSSRTCENCGKPHRNRKVNRCNLCRIGICETCNKKCNRKYKKCYDCAFLTSSITNMSPYF